MLDVLFALIKSKNDVSGPNIFYLEFLYTTYTDDTTFFVKDLNSVDEIVSNLKLYSNVCGLYPNIEKCEIEINTVLKNVNLAFCVMKSVNLMEYSIIILGVHISHNKKLKGNMNVQMAKKQIKNSVLKVWKMGNLKQCLSL